jgi:hypothetical protein
MICLRNKDLGQVKEVSNGTEVIDGSLTSRGCEWKNR